MTSVVSVAWRRLTAQCYFTFAVLGFLVAFLLLPSSKVVNNYYYALLGLPALVLICLGKAPTRALTPLLALWLGLAVWLLVSGGVGGDFGYFKYWVYLVVFCSIVVLWVDPTPFRANQFAFWAFFGLAAYVVGSAVYIWSQGMQPVGVRIVDLPLRLTGPILSSMLLVSFFALALPGWIRGERWLVIVVSAAVALFCIGYVLQSRSGLVGMATVLLTLVVYLAVTRNSWVSRGVLLILMVASGAVLAGFFEEIPALQQLITRGDSGRFELWREFALVLKDCGLLIGCGPGYSEDIYIRDGLWLIQHPHNIVLAAAFYHGLLAALLFVAALALTLWHAWRQRNPWGLYLLVALWMLMFDGGKLVASPDEIWLLVYLPAMLILAESCSVRNLAEADLGGVCRRADGESWEVPH